METKTNRNDIDCPYCNESFLQFCTINRGELDEEDSYHILKRVFHENCSAGHNGKNDEEALCGFCRHLRLGHLLRCLRKQSLPFESLRFCRFEDINTRQECPLCRLIIRSGLPYSIFAGAGSSAKCSGASLEICFYSGSILPRIRYRDGSWRISRRVYYEDRNTHSCAKEEEKVVEVDDAEPSDDKGETVFWDEKHEMELSVSDKIRRKKSRKIGTNVDWAFLNERLEHCYSEHHHVLPALSVYGPRIFDLLMCIIDGLCLEIQKAAM